MPPRSTPPPKGSFYPQNDNATYRDLLLFEERLKTNAASLQKRKSRYQLFLLQLLLSIAFLLSEVLLPPQSSILAVPYRLLLQRLLPDIYKSDVEVTLHPYFASGLLFVNVTTLALFFASGMYSEKIAYANKYVPHANRALRSFNMYLNVRKPPLRSKFSFNPLSFFFPRPNEHSDTSPSPSQPARSRSPSPSRSPFKPSSSSLPIPSIPPATNPRGELIFFGRVDRTFRENYERYRAAFERKREERERAERRNRWLGKLFFWRETPAPSGLVAPAMRTVSSSSSRGKGGGSRSGTPPTTLGAGSGGTGSSDGIVMRQRERGGSPARQGSVTPPRKRGSSVAPSQRRERGRREIGHEDDMRTLALERSLSGGLGR